MDPETPKEECWCSKDGDGRCTSCSERLAGIISELATMLFKLPRMASAICQPCRKAHADWAAAKAIRQLVAEYPGMADLSAVTAFVNNFVFSSGITKTPLLDAEIRRLTEQKKDKGEGQESSPKV